LRTKFRALKSFPLEYQHYLFIYIAGGLWGLVFALFQPSTITMFFVLGVGYLVSFAAVLGSTLAIIGLVRRDHLLLERMGAIILISAPAGYVALQLGLFLYELFTSGSSDRLHLVFLGSWMVIMLNKRQALLKDKVRQARMTPLDEEKNR
jgi:hypothetical protein